MYRHRACIAGPCDSVSVLAVGSLDCRSEICVRAATRGHSERGWWRNTHSLLESAPIANIRSFLSVTEAAKMTIKKSKTVVFERRAGVLTALYCMNDWMIAVVLAIITMMSVWAALIIYRYIQTERGKRRRKVDDDTILETEKDDNETRNEEEKILSRVESTGKSTFISVHSSLIGPRILNEVECDPYAS